MHSPHFVEKYPYPVKAYKETIVRGTQFDEFHNISTRKVIFAYQILQESYLQSIAFLAVGHAFPEVHLSPLLSISILTEF